MTRSLYFSITGVYLSILTTCFALSIADPNGTRSRDDNAFLVAGLVFLYGLFHLISAGNKRRKNARNASLIWDWDISPLGGVRFASFWVAMVTLIAIPPFLAQAIMSRRVEGLILPLMFSISYLLMASPSHKPEPSQITKSEEVN